MSIVCITSRSLRHLLLALFMLCGSQSFAASSALDTVRDASNAILAKLQQLPPDTESRAAQVEALIHELLLPHIDEHLIARRVLGDSWELATQAQESRFVHEFSRYMVRFYVHVFLVYSGERVDYRLGEDVSHPDRRTVTSLISQTGSQPIAADYLVERREGVWRVTDIIVDGISLVKTNRSQFKHLIARDGLERVIEMLSSHNNKPMY